MISQEFPVSYGPTRNVINTKKDVTSAYFHQYIYIVWQQLKGKRPLPLALYNNGRSNVINKRDTSHDVQRTSKDLGNTLLQLSHKHMNKV